MAFDQLEVLITILLICFDAVQRSGHHWPVITEVQQEMCMTRLSGRIRFTEGLPPEQQAQVVAETISAHDEPWLLASTFNQLTEHGISKMAQARDNTRPDCVRARRRYRCGRRRRLLIGRCSRGQLHLRFIAHARAVFRHPIPHRPITCPPLLPHAQQRGMSGIHEVHDSDVGLVDVLTV